MSVVGFNARRYSQATYYSLVYNNTDQTNKNIHHQAAGRIGWSIFCQTVVYVKLADKNIDRSIKKTTYLTTMTVYPRLGID